MRSIEILPTNTSPETLTELTQRTETLKEISPWIQLDIADGVFVPVVSWPYQSGQWAELEVLSRGKKLPYSDSANYEVHLMVQKPREIGELLARAGAKRILGHAETFSGHGAVASAFSAWKAAGAEEVGLAFLLDTPLAEHETQIAECDVVQLMSIATLGRQGATFEPKIVQRIQELHAKYPELTIEIDGGVSTDNIAELARAGATRFGVGSAIMKSEEPKRAYETLKMAAENALQ